MSYPAVWAYALEIEAHTGVEVVTLYISTSPALVTKPGDIPPSTTFKTGLNQPGNYSISCFDGGKTYGKASIGYGEIILDNYQGQYDFIMDYAFDGRPATLRRIDASLVAAASYPADWTVVYTGTLDQPLPEIQELNSETITIPWRDRMVELQVPLPLGTFKGDNVLPLGLEGTADDLANKAKPLILGKVFEIAPVCVNTSKLIYAASPPIDGTQDLITNWDSISNFDGVTDFFGTLLRGISAVTVYDSGLEIPQQSAYADENDLLSNAPAAGYCRVLPTNGYIRFGSMPTGQVTVTCTDGSSCKVGTLTQAVLSNYLRWPSGRYSSSDLTTLDTQCPYTMGTIITDANETADQILDYLCGSGGICYYFDPSGVFRAFQIKDPSTQVANFTLSGFQIESMQRVNSDAKPARGVRIKQQRCWTVQKTGLAGGVTAARRTWIGTEWRENYAENTVTRTKHLLSQIIEFETAFAEAIQSETDRRKDLYCVRRDYLEVNLLPYLFDFTSLRLGMVGEIQLGGRFGYAAKNMLLIGITADLANEKTTLTLWG